MAKQMKAASIQDVAPSGSSSRLGPIEELKRLKLQEEAIIGNVKTQLAKELAVACETIKTLAELGHSNGLANEAQLGEARDFLRQHLFPSAVAPTKKVGTARRGGVQESILAALNKTTATHIDEIVSKTGLEKANISAALNQLKKKNAVKSDGVTKSGKYFLV
jgi:predicted Rossmann fold nucleotide-binding protein DprA/Smf involved in DNA uptake